MVAFLFGSFFFSLFLFVFSSFFFFFFSPFFFSFFALPPVPFFLSAAFFFLFLLYIAHLWVRHRSSCLRVLHKTRSRVSSYRISLKPAPFTSPCLYPPTRPRPTSRHIIYFFSPFPRIAFLSSHRSFIVTSSTSALFRLISLDPLLFPLQFSAAATPRPSTCTGPLCLCFSV